MPSPWALPNSSVSCSTQPALHFASGRLNPSGTKVFVFRSNSRSTTSSLLPLAEIDLALAFDVFDPQIWVIVGRSDGRSVVHGHVSNSVGVAAALTGYRESLITTGQHALSNQPSCMPHALVLRLPAIPLRF